MINVTNALITIDDLRLVILSDSDAVENWEASLRGATDVCQWAFAEGIVASKMSKWLHLRQFCFHFLHHFGSGQHANYQPFDG
jgi:hypothetical protein